MLKSKSIDKLRIATLNRIAHTLQGIFRKLFCKFKDISPVHRLVRQCLIDRPGIPVLSSSAYLIMQFSSTVYALIIFFFLEPSAFRIYCATATGALAEKK